MTTIDELLTDCLEDAMCPAKYKFSSKQRSRIFRRRPKEFRERWKLVYRKWLKHHAKRNMSKEILRRCTFFDKVVKRTQWTGRQVTLPVKRT